MATPPDRATDTPIHYATGIGSRDTPEAVLRVMEELGSWLANRGNVVRSGHAAGADEAFEYGVLKSSNPRNMEIYMPWQRFGDLPTVPGCHHVVKDWDNYPQAVALAESIHPAWHNLSNGARLLHSRNPYQVLGPDLATPSAVVFCHAKPGRDIEVLGGTRTAVMLALRRQIPVFNLYHPHVLSFVKHLLTH